MSDGWFLKKKYFIIIVIFPIFIVAVFLLNTDTITQQGSNYKVRAIKIPIYLKLLNFFDRHLNYQWAVAQIVNDRMTEMQAAIGRRQLKKLPDWLASRRRNAAILTEGFSRIPGLRVTTPPETVQHAFYKYYVFVRPEHLKAGWDRERIMNAVAAEGVPCFSGTCSEIYLEKAFDGNGLRPAERLPVARNLGETSLMFLVHHTLMKKDMNIVVEAVLKVMAEAGCS